MAKTWSPEEFMSGNAAPARASSFDAESSDYDMESALAAGLKPGADGHWPSRDPKTGLLLKGKKHETWGKLEAGEAAAGMEIYKQGGRYYSRPKGPRTMSPIEFASGMDALDRSAVEHASLPNQAKAVAKDLAGNLLGVGGQLMDMFIGTARVGAIPGTIGTMATAAASGAGSKLTGQAGLEYQDQFLPAPMKETFGKIATALGPTAEEYYRTNGLARFLQMFGESVEKGGKVLSEKTGYPEEYITIATNQALDIMGMSGVRLGAKKALDVREKAAQERVMARQRRPADAPNFTPEDIRQQIIRSQYTPRPKDMMPMARTPAQEQFLRNNPQYTPPRADIPIERTPEQTQFLKANPQFRTQEQLDFLRDNPQRNSPLKEVPKSGDIPIIGEESKALGGLPPILDSALDKIRNGRGFDMTAQEKIILKDFQSGKNSPLILPEKFRDAKGAADPRLLAGLASFGMGTVIGNYISENPEIGEGLGLALPFIGMGAVKEKGGMWHPEAIERLSRPLKPGMARAVRELGMDLNEVAPEIKIQSEWSDKAVRNYLNKHAGTATDPLKDIEIPYGERTRRWEELTDSVIGRVEKPSSMGTKFTEKLPEGTPLDQPLYITKSVSSLTNPGGTVTVGGGPLTAITSYLSHVGDYLRENVPADKLPQYDLVRAVKETQKWDADMAKRMAKERADMTSSMPVYKDYGDGYKWVEVRAQPLIELPPGWKVVQTENIQGGQRLADVYRVQGPDGHSVGPGEGAAGWFSKKEAESAALELARKQNTEKLLKDEGDQMGHCVGGYCDYVENGDSKIYSLRDSKGKSHVTIEVEPPKPGIYQGEQARGLLPADDTPSIRQIKGKQNRAPVAEYLPYVQDFVKSGKWGEVGDLRNAGLRDLNVTDNWAGVWPEDAVQKAKALHGNLVTPEQLDAVTKNIWGDENPFKSSNQRGSIDPELLKTMGAAGLGGLAGYFAQKNLDRGDPIVFGVLGALTGVGLRTAAGKAAMLEAAKKADYTLGPISTRVLNKMPELWRRQQQTEMNMLRDKAEVIYAAEPLFVGIEKLGKGGKALEDALTKNDFPAVEAELARNGTPEMKKAYSDMRAVISHVADEARALGRITKVDPNHFPRVVKNFKGLKKALNQKAREGLERMLFEAERKMQDKHNRTLNETERTKIIEQYLSVNGRGSFQPDYAKARKIKDVTDGILPFYHKPVEAFHIRMGEAIADIEKAKFFGKAAVNKVDGGKTYLDLDKSIAGIMEKYEKEGKLSNEDAAEMRSIFQSRYKGGEQFMTPILQDAKNLISAGLLGNIPAAIGQYADVGGIVGVHGMKPTLKALAAQLTGNSKVLPREFGLIDHVSQEFISSRPSAKALNWMFSHSMLGKHFTFSGADVNMKQLAMNAALEKGFEQAKKGDPRLAQKYAAALGDDFPQLVQDLMEKKTTPLTREYVFNELTRTQPLTKFELPQWALDNPNGRILLSMKTWAMKQVDLLRRDVYNEIKAGRKAQGYTNLLKIGLGLGMGGATIAQIQNFILGREKEMELGDVMENAMKTFALNEYTRNDIAKGNVVKAIIATGTPPYKIFDDIVKGIIFIDEPEARNKLVRYLPDVGPILYNQFLGGKEQWNKRERQKEKRELREESMTEEEREQRREMRRLMPGEREAKRKELREQKKYEVRPVRSIKPIDSFIEDKDIYSDTAGRGIINKRGQVERTLERMEERLSKREHIAPLKFEREYTQRALGKISDPKERRRIEGLIDREINLREQWRNRAAFKRKIQA